LYLRLIVLVRSRISRIILSGILLVLPSFLFADGPIMRVGLAGIGKPNELTIQSSHQFEIRHGDSTIAASQPVTFSLADEGITITSADTTTAAKGPIRIVPLSDDAVFEIVSPKVRYARYRGILEISGGRALSMVNELALEEYVKGVIPVEVPAAFHPEAQKALTVAIRTYALRSLDRHRSEGFNVCDGIHCQGFSGASREAAWVDKLGEETRGEIIVYQNEPIYAVYSSDCGGMTQSSEDAGIGRQRIPYLRSVVDSPERVVSRQSSVVSDPHPGPLPQAGEGNPPFDKLRAGNPEYEDYCAGSPWHTWSKTFSADELDRVFSKSQIVKIGKFKSMEFAEYDGSGRVKAVLIKGDQGEYRMTGNRFREMFGLDTIKSTRMTLTATPEGEYAIEGKGYGHGIGLCAFGANGLAKSGAGYVDILKHYYTGVEVRAISDSKLQIAD